MYFVVYYGIYLVVCLAAVLWTARALYRNGRVFLADAFSGNPDLARSLNYLLVLGFWLLNIGSVTSALGTSGSLNSMREVLELVRDKMGRILVILGLVYFLNVFLLSRFRGRYPARPAPPRPDSSPGGWAPESAPMGKVLE